jgi:hypothetical protein
MKAIKAFFAFVYDFIVGDDWRLAVAVVLGLALTWLLNSAGYPMWWVLPIVCFGALAWSLRRALLSHKRQ